ncbi:MAG: hypothetical protein MEQ07_11740 [Aquimonas sp.]|nr:hypothetical protein [Aquimonas sp.]
MSNNPYATPRARSLDTPQAGGLLYSPTQVALGTFVGGVCGLVYFLRANFLALGNHEAARNTLLGGAAALVLLALIATLVPGGGGVGVALALVLFARWVAESHQMSKQAIDASGDFDFQSGWRVFGMALACMVASFALVFALILAFGLLLA